MKFGSWYIYHEEEQTEEAATGADATYWWLTSPDGSETIYVLGLSVECLERGRSYVVLCILHELAHVLCNNEGHTVRFHAKLNELLLIFEASTGETINNDYCGLETRYDSRPWTLPDDIPVQQTRRGTAFRTEARR